jgi:hypothetical protein
MCLLVYIPRKDEQGKQLQGMIGNFFCQDSIEIFYDFTRFDFRLRNRTGHEDIALLYASTSKDLNDLIACRNLLSNLRLVIILPDSEENTIAKGHLLRPRFLSYQDNGFSDLSAVLQKMLKTSSPPLTETKVRSFPIGVGVQSHPSSFLRRGSERRRNHEKDQDESHSS